MNKDAVKAKWKHQVSQTNLEVARFLKTIKVWGNQSNIFDTQINLHEYKRQQMNALYVISKYLDIKAGKPARPNHCSLWW